MLRNLHALYEALEGALDRNAELPCTAPVRMPTIYRAAPLAADLRYLQGSDWSRLPLTATMKAYVSRVEEIGRTRPELLAAHAYVRYMGDLSGGQILRDMVRRGLALNDGTGTAFYDFDGGNETGSIKEALRTALDALPVDDQVAGEIVAEARAAFARHIELFEELSPAPL